MIHPMMEVIIPSFQMLLLWTATKVMKHGTHQDHPGWVTANMYKCSAQADAFPVLILRVVERRRTIPITGHTVNLLVTFEYSQLSSRASSCCPTMQEGGRHLTWQSSMTGAQATGRSISNFGEMLKTWPLAHSTERMVWTDCWAACCLCVCAPDWTRAFLWNLHVFTQVFHACYPGTQLCLLGQRDSLVWHTDALSELKSWQNLLIIFARAPQGRQAMLSRCASHFLAY